MVDAVTRAQARLFELQVIESFIAQREHDGQTPDDTEVVRAVADELLSHQSADGSWGGKLQLTAEALLLLAELRIPAGFLPAVARAEHFLRSCRNQPGRWTDGCTTRFHELGICAHFGGGFFSPAPPSVDLSDTQLANGLVFRNNADARLGLSCLALHAVRWWSRSSIDDLIHLDTLRRIADVLFRPGSIELSMSSAVLLLSALTSAPRQPHYLSALHGALTRLAGLQRADGTWPDAEAFHVADLYILAGQRGYGSPVFDAAIGRVAELLVLTQDEDGGWGSEGSIGPYRLLSGWRVLRHCLRLKANQ